MMNFKDYEIGEKFFINFTDGTYMYAKKIGARSFESDLYGTKYTVKKSNTISDGRIIASTQY